MTGADDPASPLTPERWVALEPHVNAALALPPAERPAYFTELAATDPALAREVERLVSQGEQDLSLLDDAANERFDLLFTEATAAGPAARIRDRVQSSLGAAYTVEREIGGSGMARVFVADEQSLGRHVVIKVLTPELASEISAERFAREIKLAASLQQANIVPLLSAGTAAGLPYYTMPYVDGRSLRDRLAREGALPISEGLNLLRDVARALVYAHARGVVHRDIKPGNVLLSGGTAVVTDFGIAKALGAARDDGDAPAAEPITRTGMAIGTPAYMAPEQATGDPRTDHRADLYAFGCVAYEVFTGRPPFQGAAPHEIIAAHFNERPKPVTATRADVPPVVSELIERCLEKRPERRPQSAEEVLAALDLATSQPTVTFRPRRRGLVAGTLSVAAIVVAGALFTRPWRAGTAVPTEPLAIGALPFHNLANDSALDYLSDGLSDEILTALGKVPGLRVSGRQSAYRYRGRTDFELPGVERQLQVRLLVTGTLRQRADQFIISAQLNDSATQGELWSGEFAHPHSELGLVAGEIARALTDTLRVLFRGQVAPSLRVASTTGTTSGAAYEHYLIARELLRRRLVQQSAASFDSAIALDPGYARAHAARALSFTFYPYFYGTPPADVRDSVIAEARLALDLDSTLADAHIALGNAHENAAQWDSADMEFRHAIELDPDNFEAHFSRARTFVTRCRGSDALRALDQAAAIEPVSGLVSVWKSMAFYMVGRPDSALSQITRALLLDSTQFAVTNNAAAAYLALHMDAEARRILQIPEPPRGMTTRPYVLAKLGDTAAANDLLHETEHRTPRPWYVETERAYVRLATGDTAAALDALEESARRSGPMWAFPLLVCLPAFDPVRQSPRFAELLRQANLDVKAVTARRPRG